MNANASDVTTAVKRVARLTLGVVWIYQGIIPKLFTAVPLEHDIVERTGLYLFSPLWTMRAIGILEVALGLWLLSGYRERLAVLTTSVFLFGMTVLVVFEEPYLLVGPFGGIAKNVALFALAWIAWRLAPPERG